MSQFPISVSPDMARFVEEHSKIRQEYQKASNTVQNLEKLSAQTLSYGVAQTPPIVPPAPGVIPSEEVQTTLNRLQKEIGMVNQIEQQIKTEQSAIYEIQHRAKNLILTLYILGGIAVLVIIIVILLALGIL